MEHTCKYCDQVKTEAQMAVRGGKVSKQCLECKQSRASLGAGEPKKKAKRRARVVEKPELEITVPGGGHGFTAAITDEDTLLITQENADAGPDNIVLTKHEARAMFDKFGEWIVEP